MLCQRCQKEQAVLKLEHKMGSVSSTLVLCNGCANKMYDQPQTSTSHQQASARQGGESGFAFDVKIPQQALASFVQIFGGLSSANGATQNLQIKCKDCGTSFEDFKGSLYVGCPHCYDAFGQGLMQVLQSVQGSTVHKSLE
ncbi:MAG: hypothetical protein FWD76_04360 [Firmicutes bacterium]|nr:hypothetical protein [Bacillota bacterium]